MNDFIQTELLPVTDAGGHLKTLNSNVLMHTCLVMLALAVISAFIGSAVGVALYEVVVDPVISLVRAIWKRSSLHADITNRTTRPVVIPARASLKKGKNWTWSIGRTASIVLLLVVFFLASQSSDLFIFSPDVSIHNAPQLGTIDGGISAIGTTKSVWMHSPAMGNKLRLFDIYLPPTYFTAVGKNKHYPTIYLLHGSPGKAIDWFTAGNAAESANALIATREIQEPILVMPDGNGAPGATTEWGNSGNGKQAIETFVAHDLVTYVDQHYRTIPDAAHRAIGGLSMGGFGSMNIAIHHPDVFNWVVPLGGYYYPMGSIWGPSQSYRQYNSPQIQITRSPAAQKLHIFLGDAMQDAPYYKDTVSFSHVLDSLHIKHIFWKEKGHHSWKVWTDGLYLALKWINWGPIHPAPRVIPPK
ncbi:hypothetical protein KDI_49160 [Dictyobacter arantiisoli]|uniref:Esterase n=1 Tax=Dictyobacter arantiisoli TaxID=2014874 RepID=A0A5A5TJ36_9CHLR|nr:hypothetical protein KDI_49160 [Dictyobacter arantiisoli]